MPAPFVLQVLSDRPDRAERLALALKAAFSSREVVARIESGAREVPGTVAAVGVLGPEGTPSWISPLPADGREDDVVADLVTFLERWGFIPGRAAPAS